MLWNNISKIEIPIEFTIVEEYSWPLLLVIGVEHHLRFPSITYHCIRQTLALVIFWYNQKDTWAVMLELIWMNIFYIGSSGIYITTLPPPAKKRSANKTFLYRYKCVLGLLLEIITSIPGTPSFPEASQSLSRLPLPQSCSQTPLPACWWLSPCPILPRFLRTHTLPIIQSRPWLYFPHVIISCCS